MAEARTVTLHHDKHGRDVRSVWARMTDDGSLVVEGQDLGPTVEEFWGQGLTEYEWWITVDAADIPRLLELLGEEGDVLDAVAARFSGPEAHFFYRVLREHGIEYEFTSRLGD